MSERSPQWADWIARAEAVDILSIAERLTKLRRAGVDYLGNCPAGCTTHGDGFVVSPKKSIFLCRPSGATGNVIVMARHALGCGFAEALEYVTGESRPDRSHDETDEERERRAAARAERDASIAERRSQDEADELAKRRRDEEAVAEIVKRAVPIAGTHAEAYLRARGLTPARRRVADLKFVAELDYWGMADDKAKAKTLLAMLPAMVAIVRNVAGEIIGVHQTFLDPIEPRKWKPIGSADNGAKKVRGEAKGGMIRLGMIGDALAIGEGIETTLGWHALGVGPEDVSIAAGISLGNIAGGCTASVRHPTKRDASGKATAIRNGVPDMDKPGVVLPADVRSVILLGDGDSEPVGTLAALATATRRYVAEGRTVAVAMAPPGMDWADVNKIERDALERAA
jgi:hypothetical protein